MSDLGGWARDHSVPNMSGSSCGACTLCCTLMRVEMTPPKPAREACGHCSERGCAIYDHRPDVCEGFKCLWLASQELPGLSLPSVMRPDRSGVVLDLNEAMTVIVHCERPASWKREPMRAWLIDKARTVAVILETPNGAALLAADGSTEELRKVGVDPVSNNRLYVRVSELPRHAARSAA